APGRRFESTRCHHLIAPSRPLEDGASRGRLVHASGVRKTLIQGATRLTANLKLQPTDEQAAALRLTLERANAPANAATLAAWQSRVFRQFALHKLVYRTLRSRFGLAAQMAAHVIGKVADAYKS